MHLNYDDIDFLPPALQAQIRAKLGGGAAAEAAPPPAQEAKPSKYKNKPCDYLMPDGSLIHFDSKKECSRFGELRQMEQAGLIQDLRRQVKYELIPAQKRDDGKTERACSYIADFVYKQDGKEIVEDAKGYRDAGSAGFAKFVIKRKLMLYVHGITVKEV